MDSCEVGLGSHVLQMEGLSLREGLSLAQPGTAGTGETGLNAVCSLQAESALCSSPSWD